MVIICRLIDGYFPQMDIEYKIVIYYGMKYKCTDFIARCTYYFHFQIFLYFWQ